MISYLKKLILLVSIFSFPLPVVLLEESTSSPIVQLKTGQIRGKQEYVPQGQAVDLFLGIPYAEPPTGELRFAAPLPAKPWNGVLDATEYGPHCPQGETIGNGVLPGKKSEDCLSINVYRPANLNDTSRLPVMVWIHGGGLYHGSGGQYDGSVLASYNDVIVVNFNYRLGLLGFLNIAETELKGNYGMFDQVMALKWVQENIGSFGGNSEQVTLFGESAGGSSTDLHILSPLSKGLFHKTISQSGSATTGYVTVSSKLSANYFHFAEKLNCLDKKQMLACLRSKSVEEIIEAQGFCDFLRAGSYLPVQVVDGIFLPDKPSILMSEGRFNPVEAVILGLNKNEGVSKLQGIKPDPKRPPTRESFQRIFNKFLFFGEEANELTKQAILYRYTNHTEPDSPENLLQSWRDIVTDSWYCSRAVFSAKTYAKAGVTTYLYQFSHRSTYSTRPKNAGGVHHFDDVQYMFGVPWKPNSYVSKATSYTDVERGMSIAMMRLWTNLAKYGNPSMGENDLPTWPQYTVDGQDYLDIGLESSVKSKINADRVAFWNDLVPKLNEVDCQGSGKLEDEQKLKETKKEL